MLRKSCLIAVILGLSFLVFPGPTLSSGETTGRILTGDLDAPVKIEVFSNFDCPVCGELYLKTIRPFMRNYAKVDKVCIVYHELPMKTDKYSALAAQYSEAAYRLGREKLLVVMDELFENQPQWTENGNIEAVLRRVLSSEDLRRIKAILNVPSIGGAINRGIDLSVERKVEALPTMIIHTTDAYQKEEGRSQGYLGAKALMQYVDRIMK